MHHIFNKLKRIQRRADGDYGARIEKLNLLSLQDRRFFFLFDVFAFFIKFLMGTSNIWPKKNSPELTDNWPKN